MLSAIVQSQLNADPRTKQWPFPEPGLYPPYFERFTEPRSYWFKTCIIRCNLPAEWHIQTDVLRPGCLGYPNSQSAFTVWSEQPYGLNQRVGCNRISIQQPGMSGLMASAYPLKFNAYFFTESNQPCSPTLRSCLTYWHDPYHLWVPESYFH